MKIGIRADSSEGIGGGHTMRCLSLAHALRAKGAEVVFFTRNLPGNLDNLVLNKGFQIVHLPPPASGGWNTIGNPIQWLQENEATDAQETIREASNSPWDLFIVDHYALGSTWETQVGQMGGSLLAIDDLPNRRHECHWLLDQTYGRDPADYKGKVPSDCQLLLGSGYALLREQFSNARQAALERRQQLEGIRKVLVCVGTMDDTNSIPRILSALASVDWVGETEPNVDIVLSSKSPHLEALKEFTKGISLPTVIHLDVEDMAAIMLEADIAIGAAGSTSWERCCLGLPSVLLVLEENQRQIGEKLDRIGAAIALSDTPNLEAKIIESIQKLIRDPKAYLTMSSIATDLCDGAGAARVASEIWK